MHGRALRREACVRRCVVRRHQWPRPRKRPRVASCLCVESRVGDRPMRCGCVLTWTPLDDVVGHWCDDADSG